jgi:hypothetical protein
LDSSRRKKYHGSLQVTIDAFIWGRLKLMKVILAHGVSVVNAAVVPRVKPLYLAY